MLTRNDFKNSIDIALARSQVVALLGPRQCGKTTLARLIASKTASVLFDLEDPADAQHLTNPLLALGELRGLVVIDEIQRRPDLFPLLRVLADRPDIPCRFLILGSASPNLVRGASESLAGRIEFIDMAGFDLSEVGSDQRDRLWVRGGLPRSFLARTEADSVAWRSNYVRTFVESDIPQLELRIPAQSLRRFWTMLAHWHGQTWNASELGRAFGMSDKVVTHYLDVLCGTFMVRRLQPWHENLAKRQVKSPRIYLRDSGILHHLLGIGDRSGLLAHPKCGASWEGFAIEQILRRFPHAESYWWHIHSGPELDLLIIHEGRRLGFECKLNDAPSVTPSMRTAIADLKLEHLWVLYPGTKIIRLDAQITAVPLGHLPN